MKAVICSEPQHLEKIDVPIPKVQPGYILLKMVSLGLCGTDIHAIAGTQPYFTYPRVIGHEVGAVVEEPGPGVHGFNKGDKVVVVPYQSCGQCVACRRGAPNCCANLNILGVHQEGGMQEYISVPEKYVIPVDQSLPPTDMAVVEPYAIGRHAVVRSGIQKDDPVLVVGIGPIGLTIADLARLEGARVILAEANPIRRAFCREAYGFETVLDPMQTNYRQELLDAAGGEFPPIILDATGVIESMETQLGYLSHAGTLVYVGLRMDRFSLDDSEFHKRETSLISSRNATHKDFAYILEHMARGDIHPVKMVTHTGSFDEAVDLVPAWTAPDSGMMKGVFLF